MKHNFKMYIKLGILFFGISLFTISCQKDDLPIEETVTSNNKQVFARLLNKVKEKKVAFNKTEPGFKGNNQISAKEFDASFETKYGEPLFDKSINLTKEDGTPILVTPLLRPDGSVEKLLVGYLENNEEEFRVLDQSVKTGDVLYVSGTIQEAISCPKTNIGTKQLGGLFDAAQKASTIDEIDCQTSYDFGLQIALNSFDTTCFEVTAGSGCSFIFDPIDCDNVYIDEDGGGSGNGGDSAGGNEGGDPLGNNNGGGTDNTDPNNPVDDNQEEEPCNICGEDPFDYVSPIISCINGLGDTDDVTLSDEMIAWLQANNGNMKPFSQYLSDNGCSEQTQQEVMEDLLDLFEGECSEDGPSYELNNTVSSEISNATQQELETLLSNDLPVTATATEYKNHIQAIGQYINNLNTSAIPVFQPIKDVLVGGSNNEDSLIGDLAFYYVKSKEIFDILLPHGLQLATLGDLDNLENLLSLDELMIVENNMLEMSMLSALKELYNDHWPQNAEEWEEFGEFMGTILEELIPELIPGVSELNDLKNAINNFSNNSYFAGAADLTFAIVGIFPAGKLIKVIKKLAKGFKTVTRMTKSFRSAKQMTQAISGSLDDALPFWNSIGCKGNTKRVRELKNASEAQGKAYFDLLTKNGVDITSSTAPTGLIVKEIPDGSKIKFRNFASSADDYATNATIEFEGGNYLSNEIKELKFND